MLEPLPVTARPPRLPLGDAVAAAREEACRRGHPVVLRVGAPVPHGSALALFTLARTTGAPGFYWRDPASGRAAAALGALTLAGRRPADLPIVDPTGLPGPAVVFGRAFVDADPPAGSPWAGWPRRSRRVPRAVLVERAAEHLLIVQLPVSPEPDDAPRRARDRWHGIVDGLREVARPRGGRPAPGSRDEEPVEAWRARVAAIVEACDHGLLNKVVPARSTRYGAPPGLRFDAAATLHALRADHPGAHVFGFTDGPRAFVGATPELLARVDGRRLETHALAGTAPRGADGAEDARLGAALLAHDKDRREHRLVVDAITDSLDPLAEAVVVDGAPRLRRLPGLQHLETAITARLRGGVGLLDVVDRLHPTPALGGQPRAAALDWLARTEPLDRGWYGAPVGWLDGHGAGVAAVAIRSALMTDRQAWAFAGAGVVAGSDPDAEWRESALKLQTVGRALRLVPERPEAVGS